MLVKCAGGAKIFDSPAHVKEFVAGNHFAGARGVELELPVWNLVPGAATDFSAVHAATEDFLSRFPFSDYVRDDEGAVYRATDPATRDELSFDCSYNTLELSFGPGDDLNETSRRFVAYYSALQDAFGHRGHALTGMGINPRWRVNREAPIGNGRYRMLLHHLKSYSKYGGSPQFHDHPDFGLFSCSSQTQVDADEETLVQVINTFNLLEPFKAVLLANSPFGERSETLCGRDALWSKSLHGINPHNCGMYGVTLRSLADIEGYLESTSVYCVERGELHYRKDDDSVTLSTNPLSQGDWKPLPFTRLVAIKDGEFVREGSSHGHEYIYNPDDYRFVYMNFARL